MVSPSLASDDEDMSRKKSKRGVLPKHATQVMKSWLFQHIVVSTLLRVCAFFRHEVMALPTHCSKYFIEGLRLL